MDPLDGETRTAGKHRLLARVAEGGMGRVYLATGPSGLVAVKLVHPHLLRAEGFRERFGKEVAAAREVSGPHVAAVIDADPDAADPWLATEFVLGPPLHEVIAAGPLPEHAVLRLAAGLARALQAVHRARLVHRDLKPANIILAADGPKVVDFGIAKALEDHGTALTHSGMLIGAPGYMSPEQAESGDVAPSSDVFSLGTVLTTAYTGVNPFEGRGVPQTLYNIVHTTPDLSGLPPRLRAIAAACLAHNPRARPTPGGLLATIGHHPETSWPPAVTAMTERLRVEIGGYLKGDTRVWPSGPTVVLGPRRSTPPPKVTRPPKTTPPSTVTPPLKTVPSSRAVPADPPRATVNTGIPPLSTVTTTGGTPWWQRYFGALIAGLVVLAVLIAGVVPSLADGSGGDDDHTADPTRTPTEQVAPPEHTYTQDPPRTTTRPTPTRNDIEEAETGDCFDNDGTEDAFKLVRTTCGNGTFKVADVLHGTTDPDGCATPAWRLTYRAYDLVLCLRYQHTYGGTAYNTDPGGCVYGDAEAGSTWSAYDCDIGTLSVLERLTGPSTHDDCTRYPALLDESMYFRVTGADYLNVRLCLSMKSPGELLHVRRNNCLYVTGSGTAVEGELADCDHGNAYVTGRTGRYNDTAFCDGHGWFTWRHGRRGEYSYTVCWRWR
ncbi:hypothetical protein Afil01_29490 [Actinorhabdospora filicis]|uniref:Protein kinase domain-containing protein n=1 Tax=Actinorhabdospora filicis TaxID=1785913 RepID=A0A9W6W3G8_9ACTN|nr:serine/threonine-protein kinase [Actinorhabdospora filicis]GLZ78142.1 hypothetical protein Afil01_29490 [Actinorhabdospora filicis]